MAHYTRSNPDGIAVFGCPRRDVRDRDVSEGGRPLSQPWDHDAVEAARALAYSLLILSVDMFHPRVPVKMTKLQFVDCNLDILLPYAVTVDPVALGALFDDVARWGHVAEPRRCVSLDALAFQGIQRRRRR